MPNYVSLGGSSMAKKISWSIILPCLISLGIATILILTPIERGMFFREDYLPFFTNAAWFFIAVAVIILIRSDTLWDPMPDLALLAVVILYGLTFFWAKGKGSAIDGALKYCVYLGVFLSAKYASKQKHSNILLRWSIVASGVVAAMVGLLSAAGIVNYKDAVVGSRIYGSFQYPNALAAYEMFVCFIALHTWLESKSFKRSWARWLSQIIFSLSTFTVLLVIVLSYSRATWIIFAAVLLAYFVSLPKDVRGAIFSRFVTALTPVLLVNVPMAAAIPKKEYALVQKYILLGAAVCLVAEIFRSYASTFIKSRRDERALSKFGIELGNHRESNAKKRFKKSGWNPVEPQPEVKPVSKSKHLPMLLGAVVAVALILAFSTQVGLDIMSKIIPEAVIKRFKSIRLSDRSLLARFFATKDAYLIAKDNPFGTGAGGWNLLYHKYQRSLYWFTETHNHFAQVLVEVGFPGLIAYAAFWLGLFWLAFKAWRMIVVGDKNGVKIPTELASELVSITFAVLALVLHSSADFDLSLPAIAMALYAASGSLIGSANAVSAFGTGSVENKLKASGTKFFKTFKGKKSSATGWRFVFDALTLVVLAMVIMIPSNRLYQGMAYGSAGIREFRQGNEQNALDLMYKAIEYDPYTSAYMMKIAENYFQEYRQTQDPSSANLGKAMLCMARNKNPHDLNDRMAEYQMLYSAELYDESTEVAIEITEMIPLDVQFYENLAKSARQAIMIHSSWALFSEDSDARQQYIDTAMSYGDIIKEIPLKLDEQKSRVTGVYAKVFKPSRLDVSEPISLALGQVHFLEGNLEKCVEYLTSAGKKSDTRDQAGTWLEALRQATGTEVELPKKAEVDEQVVEAAVQIYGILSKKDEPS